MRRLLPLLILAVLIGGCGLQMPLQNEAGLNRAPSVAPNFSGPLIGGDIGAKSRFALTADHGNVVVVDFWGSWCGDCLLEQPGLNGVAAQYLKRGVVFVGVAVQDNPDSAAAYQAQNKVPYPTVMDTNETIAAAYEITAPPTVLVIDKSGHVVMTLLGTTSGLSAELNHLLQ